MRVVFVLDLPDNETLAVGCLAGALKAAGHEVDVVIATEEPDFEAEIARLKPELLGYSLIMGAQHGAIRLGRYLKRRFPHVPTVVGGPYLTTQDGLLDDAWVDFGTTGEGEQLIVELCEAIEGRRGFESVAGLVFKKDGLTQRNPPRRLHEDLDSLPLPDRSVFYKYGVLRDLSVKRFVVGRGCPFSCTFCHVSGMREATAGLGRYTRSKSPERIFAEIRAVQAVAPLAHVHFSDDVFFFKKHWVRDFLPRYEAEIGLPFTCNITADLITEPIAQLLAETGCTGVAIGLETGNEGTRVRLLNKMIRNQTFLDMAESLRRHGIKLYTNNMVGLPGETLRDALQTLSFNRKMRTTFAQCTIATPLENLPLNDWARERELLAPGYDSSKLRLEDMRRPQFVCDDPEAIANLRALFPLLIRVPVPDSLVESLVRRSHAGFYRALGELSRLERTRAFYNVSWGSGARMAAHMTRSRRRWRRLEARLG